MAFHLANWDFVKGNVLRMFSKFVHIGKFVSSFNATFIGLIPKKANLENIMDLPTNQFGSMQL